MCPEYVKTMVKEFAEKHDFLQRFDIENIENTIPFDIKKYYSINCKKFIFIDEHTNYNETQIRVGNIQITCNDIDEEEVYYIEESDSFVIVISSFSTEESLMEEIVNQCKLFRFAS